MRRHLTGGSWLVLCATFGFLVPATRSADAQTPDRAPAAASNSIAVPIYSCTTRRNAIVEAVERVRGAVVNIHSERTVHSPAADELFSNAPSQNRVNGMGTGIIVDPRGYIVTNQHVVEDVNVIRVRLSDGTTHNGRVLTREHESDLALLKID